MNSLITTEHQTIVTWLVYHGSSADVMIDKTIISRIFRLTFVFSETFSQIYHVLY